MERAHQVIFNIIVTMDIDNKVFDYIDSWGDTLAYIVWEARASYPHTIGTTPSQDIFGREIILNLMSVIEWRVLTTSKQRKFDIDNV